MRRSIHPDRLHIAVVEDDIVVHTLVAAALREAAFRATEYNRLRDAEAGISSDPSILVVLDLELPDGHGLRLMRDLQKQNSNVGVIIVSASAELEDKVNGLDLGAEDYLTKPFKVEELLARVRGVLRRAPVNSPPPRVRFAGWELDRSARILRDPSGPGWPDQRRVPAARRACRPPPAGNGPRPLNDSLPWRRQARLRPRHRYFHHPTAAQTLGPCARHQPDPDRRKFGLILSDWNMEPMTGLELLTTVRADPALKHIPFIMVTAEGKVENVVAAKGAGVNNYIVKPFNAVTLKQKIASVLGEF